MDDFDSTEMKARERARARNFCATRLISHTTSIHNVEAVAELFVEIDRLKAQCEKSTSHSLFRCDRHGGLVPITDMYSVEGTILETGAKRTLYLCGICLHQAITDGDADKPNE